MQRPTQRPILMFVLIALLLIAAAPIGAQTDIVTSFNPDAAITWPPPVYVMRGNFVIRGSAALPDMANFFIETRPLNADLSTAGEDVPWFPATLPSQNPVRDGVLGTWDTTLVSDGVYELRLTVRTRGSMTPTFAVLSPVRVENTPSPFVVAPPSTTDCASRFPDLRPARGDEYAAARPHRRADL